MMYTVICKELASWGLAVFALDHHDYSCGYTINIDTKEEIKFDTDYAFGDPEKRKEQLGTRIKEVNGIFEMLKAPSVGRSLFNNKDLKFDLDKLVVCGHSFGAITAMSYAFE